MDEQLEALQLDPQHLWERSYEAAQAYIGRCPDLPLLIEASGKQREAGQAAKTAKRESLLQGLCFLPETASSRQAELQKRSEAAELFVTLHTVSYMQITARGKAENRFPEFALIEFAPLYSFFGLRQLHRAEYHGQNVVKREEFTREDLQNEYKNR